MADTLSDYAAYPAMGYLGIRTAMPFLRLAGGPVGAFASTLMNPTTANAGEKDLYIRGPNGQMIPNPNNPMARPLVDNMTPGSPMSPMPASSPFPTFPNGMNPSNPSTLQAPGAPTSAPPPAAPPVASAVGASPAAASASPSPSPGLPLPAPRPPGADAGGGGFTPPLPPAFSRSMPSFYNGPGSSSFGVTAQAPGLMDLFKGGTTASNAVQRAPDKLGWNVLRMLSNNGQLFSPGWTASNKWYNN